MRQALLITAYALTVAWCLPGLLARLTASGMNARLGLTAWLTSMGVVLASLAIALQCLIGAAVAGWSVLAEALCRSATGHTCPPAVYQGALYEIPVGAGAVGGALTAALLGWQYGRRLYQSQRRARAHAEAAHITGRPLSAVGGVVVLDSPQPAAYCVPGRPAAIVLTSGALAILDPAQIAAVIQHEKAHLEGTHHMLVTLTRGLAAALPGMPLFARGSAEIMRLAEMRADDRAARTSGRPVLVAALLAMGIGAATPPLALGATASFVAERVQRLLEPRPRSRHAGNKLALMMLIALIATTFGALIWLAGPFRI